MYCIILGTKKACSDQIYLPDRDSTWQFDCPPFCRSFNIIPSQTGNNEPRQLKLMTVFNNTIAPPRRTAALRERRRSNWGRRSMSLPCFSYFMMKRQLLCCKHSYFVKDYYFSFDFTNLCSPEKGDFPCSCTKEG